MKSTLVECLLNKQVLEKKKSPKYPNRKYLDLINTFSKAAEYKINIQESVTFL
jgi:hypothetical protein